MSKECLSIKYIMPRGYTLLKFVRTLQVSCITETCFMEFITLQSATYRRNIYLKQIEFLRLVKVILKLRKFYKSLKILCFTVTLITLYICVKECFSVMNFKEKCKICFNLNN